MRTCDDPQHSCHALLDAGYRSAARRDPNGPTGSTANRPLRSSIGWSAACASVLFKAITLTPQLERGLVRTSVKQRGISPANTRTQAGDEHVRRPRTPDAARHQTGRRQLRWHDRARQTDAPIGTGTDTDTSWHLWIYGNVPATVRRCHETRAGDSQLPERHAA